MADTCVEDDLVDQREEVMAGNPTIRKAYFLKPTLTQDHHCHFVPPSPNILLSSNPTFIKLKRSHLVSLKAHPSQNWKIWVHNLKPKYQEVWREAGIYEAILASTHKVERNKDLVICLAERWCADTNTFVFPWGEVTISLQDIIVLGGYSVLGLPYSSPLPENSFDVLDGMKKAYTEVKSSYGTINVSCYAWMYYFMCGGKQFEHEAFLAFWLTKFVFARPNNLTNVHDFDLAIHLSRGTRIALAPLILASIYNDMTLLHKLMLGQSSQLARKGRVRFVCHIELVQMWAWERFPRLRPPPVIRRSGEPRSARWSVAMKLQVEDVRATLDSAEMSFVWCPYVESDANVDTESFVRCLRASELVGLDCIEQYLPHRVARQFGLDQDLPSHVIRSNESHESAWRNYDRPVRGVKLYIPPGLVKPDVSSRYMNWWKGYVFSDKGGNGCIQNENQVENGDVKTSSTPFNSFESVEKRLEDCVEEGSANMAQVLILSKKADCNERSSGADDVLVKDIFNSFESVEKRLEDCVEEGSANMAQVLTLSKKADCNERSSGADDVLVKDIFSGCSRTIKESQPTSKAAELSASSSSKSNKSKSSTGCTKEQEEAPVVSQGNHPDESKVEIVKESNKSISSTGCTKEVKEAAIVLEGNQTNVQIVKEGFGNTTEKQLEVEECVVAASKVKCTEADIINIEDDDYDDTTLEGLEARISRLEKIISAYKAAKFAAKSSENQRR